MFDHKLTNMSNFHRLNIAVARQNFKWVEFKCNNFGRGCQKCWFYDMILHFKDNILTIRTLISGHHGEVVGRCCLVV